MTDMSPAGHYTADINHSSVLFRIKHFGLAWYTGRFTRFEATLDFKPEAIEAMTLHASVNVLSVRGEYQGAEKNWDEELGTSGNFFDGGKHPKATFRSTKIEKIGTETAKVHGDFTLRGITKPLMLEATYNGSMLKDPFGGTRIGFSAKGVITRSQYGMDLYLGPLLPDEVQLILEAEFTLQA